MATEVVFVRNPIGWTERFESWNGGPGSLGWWMRKTLLEAEALAVLEAPGPGKPPRNRTLTNYATGELESKIRSSEGRSAMFNDLEGTITSHARHSVMVHGGTRPHVILPKNPGGQLVFRGRFGGVVFTSKVNHPGTLPNPFLDRAVSKALGSILV